MTSDVAHTNGDYVRPVVEATRAHLVAIAAWARANPDEVAVAVAPTLMTAFAFRRRHLTFTEALALSELGYWCGVLMVKEYRRWKSQPAGGPGPRLRKVS